MNAQLVESARPILSTVSRRWVVPLFVVLALAGTYPIARAPASRTYFDHPDAQLNMWIMAWDAHALAHAPRDLFNANIFYPERRTLAYSETLLGYLPLFGPVLWLHGTPALAFNVVLWFSFVASAVAMFLLVHHLTGRQWAAVVAAIAYAFVPYRFAHVPQIQLEAMEWIPFAFLCGHLFIERGQTRYVVGLFASIVIETLCCVYYGVFLVVALVLSAIVLVAIEPRAREPRNVLTLAAGAIVAALALAPIGAEYWQVHRSRGLERPVQEIAEKSADLDAYTASTARVHLVLNPPAANEPRDYLFPGLLPLVLAAIGVGARKRQALLYAAISVFAVAISFGPHGFLGLPVYNLAYQVVPLLRGLRQVSRFGVLAIFGVAVLSGFGAAMLEARLPRRHRSAVMAFVALAVFLELLEAPLRIDRPGGVALRDIPSAPPVYAWLAAQPGSFAVLELPVAPTTLLWRNAEYVFWSREHWHPLVNGYSGFAPPSYHGLEMALRQFPDDTSRAALLQRDVRYIVVHWTRFRRFDARVDPGRLNSSDWLRRVAQFPETDVFEAR